MGGHHVEVAVTTGPLALQQALAGLAEQGVALHDAGMRRPTLDDVFLTLTGRPAEDDQDQDASSGEGPDGRAEATPPPAQRVPVAGVQPVEGPSPEQNVGEVA